MNWEILGFILVPLIVAICWPILKHLLTRYFAFIPFWESQILTYITAMSSLEDALITHRQDAKIILLKIWVFLIISSIILEVIGKSIFSRK